MKRLLIVSILFLYGCSHQPPDESVFVGTSTIKYWKAIPSDRNFGVAGALLKDLEGPAMMAAQLGTRNMVYYAGENDIVAGRQPYEVAMEVENLVRTHSPGNSNVFIISLKASPKRSRFKSQFRMTNEILKTVCINNGWTFIDVFDDLKNPLLFGRDRIHLNLIGYWVLNGAVKNAINLGHEVNE